MGNELQAGRRLPQPGGRVVIIMLSAIGDAVHVLPVVNALKAERPDLHITWVIQPVPHQLVALHPTVDEFVLFRRLRGRALPGELLRCMHSLRARSFDLALGLQVYLKAGLLFWRSGARVRLGFDRRRARDLQWLFSTHRLPPHAPGHVQDQYFEFLDYLGVPHGEPHWGLGLTDVEVSCRRDYFLPIHRPVCGIILGTSKREKNWFPERYVRLIDALDRDLQVECLLLGGPSEFEREMASYIESRTGAHPRIELGEDLRRLLWLLSGCDLVVSPDTGPLHMARAIDVPVVGLYGYSNPKRTGPYRKYLDLVVDGYAHSPDEDYPLSAACRPGGMERVSVEAVLARVERALQRYPKSGRPVTS